MKKKPTKTVLPGAAVGIFGGGQLGRMLALAARRMGYRTHVFSQDEDGPAAEAADSCTTAAYEDESAVRRFAGEVDVITLEFENIPLAAIQAAEAICPVRPGGQALHVAQHRLREKTFLLDNGIPVAPFRPVGDLGELDAAIAATRLPAVLKTAGFGYDGKGQAKITDRADAEAILKAEPGVARILEAFVDFEKEISVIVARGHDGELRHWGAIENEHQAHILDISTAPARVSENVAARATEVARAIAEKLDLIGILCVEFFVTRKGEVLVNEIAPRPHNSGHLTIEASVTSQFEQQLRAVCGLPLGSTEWVKPAAMANLLGDRWAAGTPNWTAACALDDVKLHLYGKRESRRGRKMGHLTVLAETPQKARARVIEARERLTKAK